MEEIEGIFRKQFFQRDDFLIGGIQLSGQLRNEGNLLMIKGSAEEDEIRLGGLYRFYGSFGTYKGERQFSFKSFISPEARDRESVCAYLVEAGKGNGIGPASAEKCFDHFGNDTVKIIREDPYRLLEVDGVRVKDEQIKQIGSILKSWRKTEDAKIELMGVLSGRGFPKKTIKKAIAIWHNRATQVIKRDPYRLMAFPGCGFRGCDKLFIDLGHSPQKLRRQSLGAWYGIATQRTGDVWYPLGTAYEAVWQSVGAGSKPEKAIEFATRLGRISPDHYGALTLQSESGNCLDDDGNVWVAEGRRARDEDMIAKYSSGFMFNAPTLWPEKVDQVSEHQSECFSQALKSRVAILGGSPGTGKTYAGARLIHQIKKSGVVQPSQMAIAAPTGKAAVRISSAMQAAGVHVQAKTWHSLLGVLADGDGGGGWSFQHGTHCPWKLRLIIGDESSMIDNALFRSILAAMPSDCHLLLIGDVNQLPPVGSGAPLRDMIESGCFGYGELKEIRRNSGGIVEACANIRDGKPWEAAENLVVKLGKGEEAIQQAISICYEAESQGLDPVWDCQVLVAVNEKSALSRKKVNEALQKEFNPGESKHRFKINDKVVCLKNSWVRDSEDPSIEIYVANGELGRVVDVDRTFFVAELDEERTVRIPFGKKEGEGGGSNWDLAYALSVHKSQGSEWPIAIVMIDDYPGAKRICSREWIYTAISRAKTCCYLIGSKRTAERMAMKVSLGNRKTFLRQKIQREKSRQDLKGLIDGF